MKNINKKKINIFRRILFSLIIIYTLLGIFLFFNQKAMIYFPNNQDFYNCLGFNDYEKIDYSSTRFYYKEINTNKVIVYYHGNAGSACDRSFIKKYFENSNASIIFVEYAGYSNDKISPSKKFILKDVENIVKFIDEKSFNEVIVYGQSIGSGPASYHANISFVNKLMLVTPFNKLSDVVQSKYKIYPAQILLIENYDNVEWLKGYKQDLFIIHGDNDIVIPHKFSQKLFDEINSKNKKYLILESRGHNDIWSSGIFRETIVGFVR